MLIKGKNGLEGVDSMSDHFDKEAVKRLCDYRTGFIALDLMTGKDNYNEETGELESTVRGLRTGSILTIAGDPSTGKSTLALNISGNIIRNYGGEIHYLFAENGSMTNKWMQQTLNISDEQMFNKILTVHDTDVVTTEYVEDLIRKIVEEKEANKSWRTKQKSSAGIDVKEYPPTILILDSWSELMPAILLEEKKNFNNVVDATKVRRNNYMLNRFSKLFAKYNIMMFIILQTTDKKDLSGGYGAGNFKVAFKNLSHKIQLIGGKKIQYYTIVGLFLNKYEAHKADDMTKLFGDNASRIGHVVQASLWKNKYGTVKTDPKFNIGLVFDNNLGFVPELSLTYDIIHRLKLATPAGGGYRKMNGIKFMGKNMISEMQKNPELMAVIQSELKKVFKPFIDTRLTDKGKELMKERDAIQETFFNF